MALDARTRSSIFEKFRPVLGDDDANALMSEFPTTDADELVTRQFLRAEMAELRGEMAELRGELHTGLADVRAEMHDLGRTIVMWNTGSILAGIGLATAIVRLVG